jgi:predicted secreted protein
MAHLVTYLRLLDADADGADWREVARIVLEADPAKEPERVKQMWASHLARAKWMTKVGYWHLLQGGSKH